MANDATIIAGIIIFLIALSIGIPYINNEFSREPLTSENYDTLATDVETSATSGDSLTSGMSITNVFKIILGVLIWIPSLDPLYNIILVPIRMVLYFIIFRNIWVGGGG